MKKSIVSLLAIILFVACAQSDPDLRIEDDSLQSSSIRSISEVLKIASDLKKDDNKNSRSISLTEDNVSFLMPTHPLTA